MSWHDIIKRGFGLSNRSKELIDEVMLEVDEPLNIRAIMDLIHKKMGETKHTTRATNIFPTSRELQYYLSNNNKYQKGTFDIFTGKQLTSHTKKTERKYWKGMQ